MQVTQDHQKNAQKMIKKNLFLFLGGILLLSFLLILTKVTNQRESSEFYAIETVLIIPYLQNGDIILRMGTGDLSQAFSDISLTDKRFSHLGIVRIYDKNITVINSVGYPMNRRKGVDEVTLEKFLEVAKSVGIFRIKSIDGAFISEKAREYIGCPFDWNFDLSEDDNIYCTELLYVVLREAGFEEILSTLYLDIIGKDIIPLEAITMSSNIDEIIYFDQSNIGKFKKENPK
jgi:hypothetical protein